MPEVTQEVAQVSLDHISLYNWEYMVWEPRRVLLFQEMTYQIVLGGGKPQDCDQKAAGCPGAELRGSFPVRAACVS